MTVIKATQKNAPEMTVSASGGVHNCINIVLLVLAVGGPGVGRGLTHAFNKGSWVEGQKRGDGIGDICNTDNNKAKKGNTPQFYKWFFAGW